MKFLKILVSLNLVVTMPLVAPAFAADQAVSNKAVHLRPFVPNRKLPSQKELDQAALVALTPRMAPDPNAALTGRVTTFYNNPQNTRVTTSTINNTTAETNTVHRNVQNVHKFINTISALSKAAAIAKANMATTNAAPSINNTNVAVQESEIPSQTEAPSQIPAQVGYPMMHQAERHLFAQSQTTQEALADQAMIDRYATSELGSEAGSNFTGATTNSAGPPPFPLNLLPEASLKQLIHSLGRQQNLVSKTAPAATFGSWPHRQVIANRLPLAGFQSHIRGYGSARRHCARTAYQHSQGQTIARIRRNLYWTARQPWIPMSREVRNALNVAAYPPYAGQVRLF